MHMKPSQPQILGLQLMHDAAGCRFQMLVGLYQGTQGYIYSGLT